MLQVLRSADCSGFRARFTRSARIPIGVRWRRKTRRPTLNFVSCSSVFDRTCSASFTRSMQARSECCGFSGLSVVTSVLNRSTTLCRTERAAGGPVPAGRLSSIGWWKPAPSELNEVRQDVPCETQCQAQQDDSEAAGS